MATVPNSNNTKNDLLFNFGELSEDEAFKERIQNLDKSIKDIQQIIDVLLAHDVYDKLPPADQVRYDLFLAFTINTLFWIYIKTQGKDHMQKDLMAELQRVKEYMAKSKKLYERKHIMPRIDKGAAERFVRSGLWDADDPKSTTAETTPELATSTPEASASLSGKRKREDSQGD